MWWCPPAFSLPDSPQRQHAQWLVLKKVGRYFCACLLSRCWHRVKPLQVLHGDISQHQRDLTIKAFRAKAFQVLVATDVAARGIDVSDIDLVVQYRPPRDPGKAERRMGGIDRTRDKSLSGACALLTKAR